VHLRTRPEGRAAIAVGSRGIGYARADSLRADVLNWLLEPVDSSVRYSALQVLQGKPPGGLVLASPLAEELGNIKADFDLPPVVLLHNH
jgi:hypothetical protein